MINKITLETTLDLATGKTWAELIADANKAGKVLDNSVGIVKVKYTYTFSRLFSTSCVT